MLKKIFSLILFISLLFGTSNYGNAFANGNIQDNEMDTFIIDIVNNFLKARNNDIPSIVLGIVSPNTNNIFTFGKIPNGNNPTETSVYSIGSISKLFTGLITAKGVSDGYFGQNTQVGDLIDNNLSGIIKDTTIGDLVSHFASYKTSPSNYLKSDIASGYGQATNYTYELLVECLSNSQCSKTSAKVGTEYKYSNLGLGLLGIVLTDFYKKNNFEDILKSKLTGPLDMNNTHSNPSFYKDKEKIVTGFNKNNQPVPTATMGALVSAGGILTTGEDMMKLLEVLIRPTSSWKKTIEIATNPFYSILKSSDIEKGITKKEIGYSIDIITQDGINIFQKYGGTSGSTSLILWSPELKSGAFILINKGGIGSTALSSDLLMPIIKKIKEINENNFDKQEINQILNDFYLKLDKYTSNVNKKINILNEVKRRINSVKITKKNKLLLLLIKNSINNKIQYYINIKMYL